MDMWDFGSATRKDNHVNLYNSFIHSFIVRSINAYLAEGLQMQNKSMFILLIKQTQANRSNSQNHIPKRNILGESKVQQWSQTCIYAEQYIITENDINFLYIDKTHLWNKTIVLK
jgi:hypothetical protein